MENYLRGKNKVNFDDNCFKVDASFTPRVYTSKEKTDYKSFAEKLKREIFEKWRCSDREKFVLFVVAIEKAFGYDVGVRTSDGNGLEAKYIYFNCIPTSFVLFIFVICSFVSLLSQDLPARN